MAVRNTKLTLRFLFMLGPALLLVALGFLFVMDNLERRSAEKNLDNRAQLLARTIEEPIIQAIHDSRPDQLDRILKNAVVESPVMAVLVCTGEGKLIRKVAKTPGPFNCSLSNDTRRVSEAVGTVVRQFAYPLHTPDNQTPSVELIILQSVREGLERDGAPTRKAVLIAFLILVSFASLVTIFLDRWNTSRRLDRFGQALKRILKGDGARLSDLFESTEFAPLIKDLNRTLHDLAKRKPAAGTGTNLPDASMLRGEAQRLFGRSQICVIANREPYIHNKKGKAIEVVRPASGLVTAMEPIVRACSGLWIGHGSGTADRESADPRGLILVPPESPEYGLKRVWLTREEEKGYYYGFANEGLWPLCHIAHNRPIFRKSDWKDYVRVNEKFASAFVEEMKTPSPVALIQDYHFACLPEMIRRKRSDAVLSLFWHIPWPNPESIRICPWKTELLKGMLGADLIGFHIQYHCNNFLDAVDAFLEARVDRANFTVTMKGHTSYIRPFPISIEWPPSDEAPAEDIPSIRAALLEELGIAQDCILGVGVDRLDYTKGIVERLLAVQTLLETHPELIGKFVFVQISAPSRTHIKRYQELDFEVKELALNINARFHRDGYEPVILRNTHHNTHDVFRFYRAADVCLVTALHDGMNLVAKEFVAARSDLGGALVLSSFTGAARELTEAYIVNPYNIEETAETIYRAISVSPEDGRKRMKWMRELVSQHNVYDWAHKFLVEVHRISERRQMPSGTQG
jgi:trehalose-6-phosphate synthase